MYVTNFNNKSEANYLAALSYIESRGTPNVCSDILYSVTNCLAASHLTSNVL